MWNWVCLCYLTLNFRVWTLQSSAHRSKSDVKVGFKCSLKYSEIKCVKGIMKEGTQEEYGKHVNYSSSFKKEKLRT